MTGSYTKPACQHSDFTSNGVLVYSETHPEDERQTFTSIRVITAAHVIALV
jgi:hypothetical protein